MGDSQTIVMVGLRDITVRDCTSVVVGAGRLEELLEVLTLRRRGWSAAFPKWREQDVKQFSARVSAKQCKDWRERVCG